MDTLQDKPYKVALVALDLTLMDDHIIRYAATMSKVMGLERIFFVYIPKSLELPSDLLKKFPDLMAPLDESLKSDIQAKVDQYFADSNAEINYVVKEGNPIDKILRLCKVKHIDLVFMGRKKSLVGSGLISSHIARKCPCSLLLVTQNGSHKLNKLLVPLDFSGHSSLALKQALRLSDESGAKILLTNIYSVPTGFSKTGKTYEEFAEIMKGHAKKDCKVFLRKHKLPQDLKCDYLLKKEGELVDVLYAKAKEEAVNLILIGSKGRTDASAILMGSMSEKLVLKDSDIPILIVKNKGENQGFLDTLMRI